MFRANCPRRAESTWKGWRSSHHRASPRRRILSGSSCPTPLAGTNFARRSSRSTASLFACLLPPRLGSPLPLPRPCRRTPRQRARRPRRWPRVTPRLSSPRWQVGSRRVHAASVALRTQLSAAVGSRGLGVAHLAWPGPHRGGGAHCTGVSFLAPRGKFDVEFRQSSLSFIDKNGALVASCPIANIAVGLARIAACCTAFGHY